jgi:hypothetical protein
MARCDIRNLEMLELLGAAIVVPARLALNWHGFCTLLGCGAIPVQTRMNVMERVFVFAAARDPEWAGDAIPDEAKETRRRRDD